MPRARSEPNADAPFEMRREPQQRRSKNTVSIIKQAALEVLCKEGYAACSTERIAARAGLSIGSFYKYFPNRDSILKTMYEDASLDYARTQGKLMIRIMDQPTAYGMESTVYSAVAFQEQHRQILALTEELPHLRLEDDPMAFHNLLRNNIRAYIHYRNPKLTNKELVDRTFFIERIVFSCIRGYTAQHPSGMPRRQFSKYLGKILADIIDAPPL